jgi:hypothetical protein
LAVIALWHPNENIGRHEHIGRRLFPRKKLKGAGDQHPDPNTFELYHFEEKRDGGEVSLDRLGESSTDRRVLRYVSLRAHHAASLMKPQTSFRGWAVARAEKLQKPAKGPELSLVASPVVATADDELTENVYHAHAVRPSTYGPYEMAMHLKMIFDRNYHFEPPTPEKSIPVTRQSIIIGIWNWLRQLAGARNQ